MSPWEDLTETTLAAVESVMVNDRTGLIQGLYELPLAPNDPKVFMVGARLADHSRWLPNDIPSLIRQAGGAGLKLWEAKAAAIGESIERYCASIRFHDELVFGSYRDLKDEYQMPHPSTFALFHPDQYPSLPYWPFTEETKVGWSAAVSLHDGQPALVPACFVYLGYRIHRGEEERLLGPSVSTGCACARSHSTALLKGIYEVIERDAFTICWLNRLVPQRLDICSEPSLAQLYRETLATQGLEYHLFRLPTDLAVPTCAAVVVDTRREIPIIAMGGAAHLDPVAAARKALLECVQTRMYACQMLTEDDDPFAEDFADIISFDDHTMLYARRDMRHALDFMLNTEPARAAEQLWANERYEDAVSQLEIIRHELAKTGLQCFAVDLTTSDLEELGFAVVKAVMPQMQPLNGPYTQRFLGGRRLYEVPVRLGLRQKEIGVAEMNPFPHPYP